MTSIPSTRALNAMCQLLADYKSGADTRPTLAALKEELGETEYTAFRDDLLRELKRVPAWKAVGNVIAAAIQRKRAVMDTNRSRRIERDIMTAVKESMEPRH
jgi:hypothetical protein